MHLFAKTRPAATPPRFFSKPRRSPCLIFAAALAAFGLLARDPAQAAEPRAALRGSIAPTSRLRAASLLGRLDPGTILKASLLLPRRNQAQLDDLLKRLYTPGDPLYHQFLTPPEFTARFGPSTEDYAAVMAYARAQGLTVAETSPGRTLLSVSGPAAKLEAAFGVQMSRYRLPSGRLVYANSAVPTLPRSIAARVAGIAGLNNIAQMHPQLRRMQPGAMNSGAVRAGASILSSHAPLPITGTGSGIGSGPLGGLSPNDIKYAYNLSGIAPLYGLTTSTVTTAATLNGSGQNIGLFELDGFVTGDIAQYITQFSLPTAVTGTAAPVTAVPLSDATKFPVSVDGKTEVTLDIDMILALAPAATGIYVYEDNQVTDASAPITLFTRMANDLNPDGSKKPLLQIISCSWGIAETEEDPTILQEENILFQTMATQGQSVFCSSGDNGAYDAYTTVTTGTTTTGTITAPVVDNPASQPYVTGVGGTTLSYVKPATTTAGVTTPGTYVGETTWSAGTAVLSPEGSGGGISSIWPKPSYQIAGASPIRRDVPDVSLNADPNTGYSIYVGSTSATPAGTAEVIGGTSAAAPLWAAYAALINQQRAANGLGSIGFMNPVLYPYLTSASSYSAYFHDIITGTNLFYPAGTGYDDATGLGSFNGAPLLAALSFNANQGTGTATLSGIVTDTSSPAVPIAGATVTAVTTSTGTTAATATTDSTGAYTLTVPSGVALKITVSTSAAAAPTNEVFAGTTRSLGSLTAGAAATQNFALSPAFVYPAGLQMISAPYDYSGLSSFAAVFGLTATQASTAPRLVHYVPSANSYVFYPTAPADTLRLGQGYWTRFPSGTSYYLHLLGTAASTTQAFSIPLQQGWNQIGDPFSAAAPLSTITVAYSGTTGPLASTPAIVQPTLYQWNSTGNAYAALNPASDSLSPYVGYWVYAFQPCSLSVPVPSSLTPPPAP